MKYLLDTNACIVYLNKPQSGIAAKLRQQRLQDVFVCSVVKAELYFGAMQSQWPEKTLRMQQQFLALFSSLPFDDEAARLFGDIRAALKRKGTPIGPYDLQIAAIAMANDCVLVTHNTGEFSRVDGLKLEDWEL